MYKNEDLIKLPEFWMENIQNEIYFALKNYMREKKLNQTELAEELGFTKGYISQVLHGNFNHSVKKLIELTIAINKVPNINLTESLDQYLVQMDYMSSGKIIEMKEINVGSSKIDENENIQEISTAKYIEFLPFAANG